MRYLFLILFGLLITGCKQQKTPDTSTVLTQLINEYENHKGYDTHTYPLGLYTKEYYQSEASFAQELLEKLAKIDQKKLNETERISAQLLRFILQEQIDFYAFERYLNPLLSDSGFHINLTFHIRPLTNLEQTKKYLDKLQAIPTYIDQHLENLRAGLKKGVSQPKVIFKGYEASYNDQIVTTYQNSPFYTPFTSLPETIPSAQKDSILQVAKTVIETRVIPQFKRVKAFFETEYLPKTRTTLGVSKTPNGKAFYQNRINYYTTSDQYTADDIHNIGLKEVTRIKSEMQKIIDSLEFKGSFSDFLTFLRTDEQFYAKTSRELLMIARDISKRADEQLPRFFKTLPRKPYGVAPVPASIAPKYTGGRYIGTSKNSTDPGYYWVNTYDLPSRTLYTLPSLTVHEAVPGHHLQGSLNNELGDSIPQFRKNLYLSAYGEGWGLYSEFLAEEMGIYTTPYEHFGKLTYEMWRACRLVVDTGIHAKGWTREAVVAFLQSNTALSLHEIQTETDRYISWPGQALSYKIGELKIRTLRKKATAALGSEFDIREFHEVILQQGTVTLSILEQRIMEYIKKHSSNNE
ncbi:DUF885 domain-containing protein [Aquimarina sp. TRL1]|uniref:DUF885 domain-containing protein n=1 Tax=Aquimarina sp. (strain TRL1) TaxID=2736252 RepID=UPI00158A6D0B|nr:DUF885 domain-containing protein [Aquimarina sp. TRL1]QKX04332.1 DUF885 domain-containing protein [Aquimarina sp. TRL1]